MHHIALFGEVLADCFPGQTILGGAPYNVTRHLRAFLEQPVLISRTGNDRLRTQLFDELSQLTIDASGIQLDNTYPTGQVIVHIKSDVHHFDIQPNQAYDYINAHEALRVISSASPSILYFGTLAQRNMVSSTALNNIFNNTPIPRFLDINLRAPWYNKVVIEHALTHADIVKVNEDELSIIATLFKSKALEMQHFALQLIERFNLSMLYVTCGERGAWVLSKAGEKSQVNGLAIGSDLVDTVGAGDAFSAVTILGILHNWSIKATLDKANTFASAICQIRGAAPATTDFYLPYINSWDLG